MTRQWSDGKHDDAARETELQREFACVGKLGGEIADLKIVNEWLRLQMACPWRVENYRPTAKAPRADRYATAAA